MANRFERFLTPGYNGGTEPAPTEQPTVPANNRFAKFTQPAQPAGPQPKSLIEQAGFAASRVGTALPHLAEFAADVPQHLGALAQFGVSGESTGVSAGDVDTALAFDEYAKRNLGAPDFTKYPGQGYDQGALGAAYQKFLTLPQNEELAARRAEVRTPEAYKAIPMLGSEVLSGQLAGVAEGIKDVTGGAVDLNETFRGAETPEEQLVEGVVEGVVTGGTGLPRQIIRSAIPAIGKRVTAAEAQALQREIAADLITGGVGGYTGTLAAQNAPEGWELAAGLAGGVAGGAGAVGGMRALDSATRAAGEYLRPAVPTKRNVERLASDALKAAASDPAAAAESIRTAQAPEGVNFTAGQAANDTGLLNLEQTLARGKDQEFREAMIDRAAEQNRAMVENIRRVEENGSPAEVAQFFAGRMDELTARASQLNDNARRLAEAKASMATDAPEAAEIGGGLQDALEAEMVRVREEIAALDRAIDPDGTMQLPTSALRGKVDEIYARMSPEERLSITGEEKALIDIIAKYGDVLPYDRFRDLRTQINEDMRNARSSGKGRAYGRMSQLRGALEADVQNAISGRFSRDASMADEFVRRARDHYTRNVEGAAGARPAAGAMAAAVGSARGVPEGAGAGRAAGAVAGEAAGDTGLPGDAEARRAVEGRYEQAARQYPIAPRSEWYGEANYETAGGRMTEMTPDEFLSRARPLEIDDVARDNIDDLKRHILAGRKLDPLKFFDGGKEDGRHRAIAAKELGIDRVPVIEFGDQRGSSTLFQSGTVGEPGIDGARPFYSAALKSVLDSKTNKASPQQWAATIKNTPGVKQEELDWLGLNSWLAQQKGAVTKDQLADFIRANQIEVEEVNLAGDGAGRLDDIRFDWEPDEPDADFVREMAADRYDDVRNEIARDEGIDPDEVDTERVEQEAFDRELRFREQEPDYHASVVVGETVYDVSRTNDGYAYVTAEGEGVTDGYLDEQDIREAIYDHYQNKVGEGDGDGATQYGEYTLPGGKDYHELLLKLPERQSVDDTRPSAEVQAKYKDQWDALSAEVDELHREVNRFPKVEPMKPERLARYQDARKEMDALHAKMVEETRAEQAPWKGGENFDAPHYDDQNQNILAHVRFKERMSVDGKRTLFLEEVQSDWHQQGRDKGYKVEPTPEDEARLADLEDNANAARVALRQAEKDTAKRVSNGEFANTSEMQDAIYGLRYAGERYGVAGYYLLNEPTPETRGRAGVPSPEQMAAAKADPYYLKGLRAKEALAKYNADSELDAAEARSNAAAEAYRSAREKLRGGVPDAPFKTTWPELALKRMIRWAADNGYDQIAWTPGNVQNARYNLSNHISNVQWFSGQGDMAGIRQINLDPSNRSQQISLVVDQNGKVVGSPQLDGAINKPLSEVVGKDLAASIMAEPTGQISGQGLAEIGGSGMREFYDRVLVSLGNKLGKKFGTQVGKGEFAIPGTGRELGIPRGKNLEAAVLPITDAMREGALRGQPLFQRANQAATSPLNNLPEPTEAQKQAGNYRKGKVKIGGLDISIENPAGSKRKGKDASGKPWSVDLKDHYGYVRGSVGKDGDHLDVFVKDGTGDVPDDAPVFVVDQIDPRTGRFDETKTMIGYADRAEAEAAYRANYAKDWKGLGAITPTTMGALKSWIKGGKTRGQFAKSGLGDPMSDRAIASAMAERFAAAGRPEPEARAAGELVDAFYATMARRTGKTVEQVQKQFPLPQVRKGGGEGGFAQAARATDTPAFRKWFGDSKVVDAEGRPLVVYRGMTQAPDGGAFRVRREGGTFGDGIYLTADRATAEFWANPDEGNAPGVVSEVYVSIRNPAPEDVAARIEAEATVQRKSTIPMLEAMGYDGIIADGEIVAFRPEQIKSVNNRGTWDANDPRMLYQARKPKADVSRDLYAVHNIKPGGVLNAAKIGGLPMPSLAVAHIGKGDFGNFGDISLIGSPRLVDPKGGTGARTYDADVYSPRYPSITYDIDDKAFNALNRPIVEAIKQYGGQSYDGVDVNRIENRGPNDAINSYGLKLAFLKEQGVTPTLHQKDGKPDWYRNRDEIDHEINVGDGARRGAYEEWAAGKLEPLVKRERIFKGFDYNGNRRYREHNIDNVLSDMRARLKEGEGFNYGVGNIRAKHAKKFGSLDAIRKDKDRLTGDMKEQKDAFSDRLTNLLDEMRPYYKFDQNGFGYMDDASTMLAEMASKGQRALAEGFDDLPSDIRVKISDFLTDLKNAPTEYFETKINRNVGLGEFEAALVPAGTQPRVVEALERAGLQVIEYDPKKPNARTDAIRQLDAQRGEGDNLLFQPAWHGSPHIFDKFKWSDETRGKGEGAQAFGDGLYFAGKKEVAQHYRDTLTEDYVGPAKRVLAKANGDVDAAIAATEAEIARLAALDLTEDTGSATRDKKMRGRQSELAELTAYRDTGKWRTSGRLYKVDIPRDDELLAWDKPLSEQPKSIRDKMAALGFKEREASRWSPREGESDRPIIVDQYGSEIVQNEDGTYSVFGFGADGRSQRIARGEPLTLSQAKSKIDEFNSRQSPTGEQMYRELAGRDASNMSREQLNDWYEREVGYRPDDDAGSPLPIDELRDLVRGVMGLAGGDVGASLALKKAGIPGHRFLDAGSRGKGDGTYNYVIYDDSRVNVTDYEQGPRGSIQFDPTGGASLINLFEKADASTALHESAHQFLHMFRQFASAADAPETLTKDWSAAKAWWQKNSEAVAKDAGQGVTAADVRKVLRDNSTSNRMKDLAIDRGLHEQWARAFEVYLRDGKAPNAAMKGIFEQFKDWLTQVYRSITGMGVNLSPDIRGVFDRMLGGEEAPAGQMMDAAGAKRLKDVTARWKDFYGTFSDKGSSPVPAIVRRSKGETYPNDMPAENVVKAVWRPGPEGAAAIRNVLKAAGPRRDAVTEGIEQSAMLSLSRTAMKDGVVDPAKFEAWKAKHADALKLVPAIAGKMESAADATREMQRLAAASEKAIKDVQHTAIGDLLKLGPDPSEADVVRKVGSLMERQGAVKAVRELVGAAKRDPDAMAGLRRAVVDHVLQRFGRDDDRIVHQSMRNWVNKNRAAIAEVLTPEQMATINAIMDASERITRKAVAPLGGSPTAEYLSALEARGESPSMLAAVLQRALGNAVQSGIVGGVGHVVSGMNLGVGVNAALGTFLSKAGLDMLRARGFAKADALLREAILNPELARALLMKPSKRKGAGAAKELERALSAGAIGILSGNREDERRRTSPPAASTETQAMPVGVGG